MNVTGVHFQRVVQGRVDQLDHPALVFADAGQRQALQGVEFVDGLAFGVQRIDGVKAFFVTGKEAGQVGGLDQVQRCTLQAVIDPGQARGVEGVGEHAQGLAVMFEEEEFALQALGQADPVEQWRGGEQRLAVQYGVMQGGAQTADKLGRAQATQTLQGIEQALCALFGGGACLGQQFTPEGCGDAFLGGDNSERHGFHDLLSSAGRGKPCSGLLARYSPVSS
ncbi:hypothetical protein D3C76_632680 [compost metagenome]